MKQNSEAEIKVESTLTSKIITLITCIVWILFISWAYIDAEVVNYKITIMYIVGVLIVIWFLLKNLLVLVYVKDMI
jgi:K+-sensing histidine kinase KdpD